MELNGSPKKKRKRQHVFQVREQPPSQYQPMPEKHTEQSKDLRGPRRCKFIHNKHDNLDNNESTPATTAFGGGRDPSSKGIVFTANKTTIGFTHRREKDPSPKPRKRPAARYPRGPGSSLRSGKPINAYIPIDAWALIFRRCDLKFLMNARLVCKDFSELLKSQTIWRQARLATCNPRIPDCPLGLTEIQYANLLVGRGCQVKPCVRRETRKIYWPFMRRMCSTCFHQAIREAETESEEAKAYHGYHLHLEPEVARTLPAQLASLLPAGFLWAGRWTDIRSQYGEGQMWSRDLWGDKQFHVMIDDYEALKAEFAAKVMTEPSYFLFWARLKWTATKERMETARRLKEPEWDALRDRETFLHEKKQFFVARAAEMDPPMRVDILTKMAAFQNVMESSNPGSLRSWDLLAPKIDGAELRNQAQQLLEWERTVSRWPYRAYDDDDDDENDYRTQLWELLSKHRRTKASDYAYGAMGPFAAEQQVVIDIAQGELDRLIDIVHDEDVLLLLLERVRKAYEALDSKPEGLNGDGTMEEYRLLLDDARLVVSEVLLPRLGGEMTARSNTITASLRCVGCTRTDSSKQYGFEELMVHIKDTHAKYVGKDLHFWSFAAPVPQKYKTPQNGVAWFHIAWPKSFPALPAHQKAVAGLNWNPEEEREYVEFPTEETPGLFDGLEANERMAIADDSFSDNFCRATSELMDTRLDSTSIFKLGLEYAVRRRSDHAVRKEASLDMCISLLQTLQNMSEKAGMRLEFKFRCGLCSKEGKMSGRHRESFHSQPLAAMTSHWQLKHSIGLDDVVDDLVVLPTDRELQHTIQELDAKLDAQKKKADVSDQRRIQKEEEVEVERRNPRTTTLLAIPSIQSRFDVLFVKQQHKSDT